MTRRLLLAAAVTAVMIDPPPLVIDYSVTVPVYKEENGVAFIEYQRVPVRRVLFRWQDAARHAPAVVSIVRRWGLR